MFWSLGYEFASLLSHPCGNQSRLKLDGLDEAFEELTPALTRADVLYGGCSECCSCKRCPGLELALEKHSTESFGWSHSHLPRGCSSSEYWPICTGDKNTQPTQDSGFYWPGVLLKAPTVRLKMIVSGNLACRYVLFGLHSTLLFLIWIDCQQLKFWKYHTKCQIPTFSGKMGSHSCLVASKEAVNASYSLR